MPASLPPTLPLTRGKEQKKEEEDPFGGLSFSDNTSPATQKEGMGGESQGTPVLLDFGMNDLVPELAWELAPAANPANIPIDWGDPPSEEIAPAGPEIDLRSMGEEIPAPDEEDSYPAIDDLLS